MWPLTWPVKHFNSQIVHLISLVKGFQIAPSNTAFIKLSGRLFDSIVTFNLVADFIYHPIYFVHGAFTW